MYRQNENQDLSGNSNLDYEEFLLKNSQKLNENDASRLTDSTIVQYGNPSGELYKSHELIADTLDLTDRLVFPLYTSGNITGLIYLGKNDNERDYIYGSGSFIVNWHDSKSIILVCSDKASLFKLSYLDYPIILLSKNNVNALNYYEKLNKTIYFICAKHEENDLKRAFRNNSIKVLALSMPISSISTPEEVIGEVNELLQKSIELSKKADTSYKPTMALENKYPIEYLPKMIREAILCIHEYIRVPIGIAANSVLFALVYIAQRQVDACDINGSAMPCSLYFLTEGESGDRKSTADKMALKSILDIERKKLSNYQRELAQFRENPKNGCEPRSPKTLFSDTTIEPIISGFINGDYLDIAIASDDAAEFLGGHVFKSDTSKASMSLLAKLFDKGDVERTRSKGNANGSGIALGCRLSMHLMGQPVIIKEVVENKAMSGIGLSPRFIFAAPTSIAGTRILKESDLNKKIGDDERISTYWKRCDDLLIRRENNNDNQSEVKERLMMPMSGDAKTEWVIYYNQIESELKANGKYASIKSFGSRAGEIIIRLATVLAFFDEATIVMKSHIVSAAKVILHSLNEWLNYDQKHVTVSNSENILNWLIREFKNGREKVLKSSLNQNIRSIKNARVRDEALQPLFDSYNVFLQKVDGKEYVVLSPDIMKMY